MAWHETTEISGVWLSLLWSTLSVPTCMSKLPGWNYEINSSFRASVVVSFSSHFKRATLITRLFITFRNVVQWSKEKQSKDGCQKYSFRPEIQCKSTSRSCSKRTLTLFFRCWPWQHYAPCSISGLLVKREMWWGKLPACWTDTTHRLGFLNRNTTAPQSHRWNQPPLFGIACKRRFFFFVVSSRCSIFSS